MWAKTFEERLAQWTDLRHRCRTLDRVQCLDQINRWWFRSPWKPYYLHWDDWADWPDPWQLLHDNYFCDLARGLGMLYTLCLLDRNDTPRSTLVLTKEDRNLVVIDGSKYILNWNADTVLNTSLTVDIKQQYPQSIVQQKYL